MFFFLSSRRRHTRYWRDWSSDVCSSDLSDDPGTGASQALPEGRGARRAEPERAGRGDLWLHWPEWGRQIGRASCRERVQISVVPVSLKKKETVLLTLCACLSSITTCCVY